MKKTVKYIEIRDELKKRMRKRLQNAQEKKSRLLSYGMLTSGGAKPRRELRRC